MNELLLIGTAATDHLARKNQPGPPASHGRRIEMGRLVFVYRAALVGFAAFAAALIGFGLQELLPAAYLATSKSMIGSIVGLIASLLSIVLGLLVWTSHGQFISQQTQLQTIAVAALQLDDELRAYGPETGSARALLRKHIARTRARFSKGQRATMAVPRTMTTCARTTTPCSQRSTSCGPQTTSKGGTSRRPTTLLECSARRRRR